MPQNKKMKKCVEAMCAHNLHLLFLQHWNDNIPYHDFFFCREIERTILLFLPMARLGMALKLHLHLISSPSAGCRIASGNQVANIGSATWPAIAIQTIAWIAQLS
jgi:hypothetical protein